VPKDEDKTFHLMVDGQFDGMLMWVVWSLLDKISTLALENDAAFRQLNQSD
jgi:hypothetical protein